MTLEFACFQAHSLVRLSVEFGVSPRVSLISTSRVSHHVHHCEREPSGFALSDGWALLVSAGLSTTVSFEIEGEMTAARRNS